jgi:hypothetical protein
MSLTDVFRQKQTAHISWHTAWDESEILQDLQPTQEILFQISPSCINVIWFSCVKRKKMM